MGSEMGLGVFFANQEATPVDQREFAELVGRVVIRAAQVEQALEVLLFEKIRCRSNEADAAPMAELVEVRDRSRISGLSGKGLASALRSARLADFADRYADLSEKRNAVVHGTWSTNITDMRGLVTTRTVRGSASMGDVRQDEWSPALLRDFCRDLERMLEDAGDQILDLAGVSEEVPRARDYRDE